MAAGSKCSCRRCTIRGMMGPAILITLGLLFLLGETRNWGFSIFRTYPVILIVMGIVSLAGALSPTDGHVDEFPAAAPVQQVQPPAPGQGR
jgi:hypothetical protein